MLANHSLNIMSAAHPAAAIRRRVLTMMGARWLRMRALACVMDALPDGSRMLSGCCTGDSPTDVATPGGAGCSSGILFSAPRFAAGINEVEPIKRRRVNVTSSFDTTANFCVRNSGSQSEVTGYVVHKVFANLHVDTTRTNTMFD